MSEPSNPNLYPNIFPWMWNSPVPNPPNNVSKLEDDDSWEVQAFAEDTSSVTGTTWPPRSYTCTFCRREFRSAQALGGHMNVHRRDRARLQLAPPPSPNYNCTPMQLGFCLVCQQLGNPVCNNGVLIGAEPPVHEAKPPYLDKEEFDIRDLGEEDDDYKEEAQVSEVELDLELRLGN